VTRLVLAVALIALPDCLNPSLILTELVLAGGARPRRDTAVFTLAAMATTFLGGVAIAAGLRELLLALLPKPSTALQGALTVGAGAVLVAGGVLLWIHRDRAAARLHGAQARNGPAALLGVTVAAVELVTAFPYFAAIALMVGSDVSDVQKVALLVLYNVLYALPLIVIAAVCAVAGTGAQRLLAPVTDWVLRRWPGLVAWLMGAAGIALLAYGVARAASAA
jgi:cytochrome c biogenesis protein CcdA